MGRALKVSLISSEQYLFTCMRYIELKVEDPSEYQWSSYHYNALGRPDPLIQPHLEYSKLGQTLAEQQSAYQSLFQIPLELKLLHEIRETTNNGWTLGDSQFKQSVAKQLDRRVEPSAKGGDRKSSTYLKTLKINPI